MAIKTYKPYTPSRRFMSNLSSDDITSKANVRSLLMKLPVSAGRNNNGRITSRHKEGGAKKLYRIIDFKRNKFNIEGWVRAIEYDPYRNSRIALVVYKDGDKRYIIQPSGLKVGDLVLSAESGLDIKVGFAMKLKNIPIGTTEIVLPAYMVGRNIWIDGKRMEVKERCVPLSSPSSLLGYVMTEEEQSIPLAPILFVVADSETTELKSWYEWGLQQYTGYLDYTTTIVVDDPSEPLFVDLEKVKYMAEVFINGQSVGARLWPPFSFDISGQLKKGENELTIRVGNLIASRMWMLDDINQLRLWQWGIPNMNLYSGGILGTVSLSVEVKHENDEE